MHKVNKNNLERYGYTIIYYEIVNETKMEYSEYVLLDTMLLYSKKNEYKKGLVFLEDKFNWSPNKVKSIIDKLYKKELVKEKIGTNYIINEDLKVLLAPINDSYGIKIYHKHRIQLGLNLNEYAILYLYYSYSRKRTSKEAYSGYEEYKDKIDREESQYYRARKKLKKLCLINNTRKNYISLADNIFKWFEQQENIKNDRI